MLKDGFGSIGLIPVAFTGYDMTKDHLAYLLYLSLCLADTYSAEELMFVSMEINAHLAYHRCLGEVL